jgi:hypothetical protein
VLPQKQSFLYDCTLLVSINVIAYNANPSPISNFPVDKSIDYPDRQLVSVETGAGFVQFQQFRKCETCLFREICVQFCVSEMKILAIIIQKAKSSLVLVARNYCF